MVIQALVVVVVASAVMVRRGWGGIIIHSAQGNFNSGKSTLPELLANPSYYDKMGDADHGFLDLTSDKMHDLDRFVPAFVGGTWSEESRERLLQGDMGCRERGEREREHRERAELLSCVCVRAQVRAYDD